MKPWRKHELGCIYIDLQTYSLKHLEDRLGDMLNAVTKTILVFWELWIIYLELKKRKMSHQLLIDWSSKTPSKPG